MRALANDRELARECVGVLGRRWSHVEAVGRTAEELAGRTSLVTDEVVRAAWLHDVGYGPAVSHSGFHPLDGARYLSALGVDQSVVNLVAFHTGAAFEAEERGLSNELAEFGAPDAQDLDALTMIDLGTSPDGRPVLDAERIEEILERYAEGDPVARAVRRSRPSLLEASARSKTRLGLADRWPLST